MPASNFLVGTAPDQVPTNVDLGEMAFQSKDAVEFTGGKGGLSHLDITAISAQLNVNATDVFVYDTSKDSDGGAWRNRCQHTSWFNETLNTATRGARREFPSVAVIVSANNTLTIYDGDHPDLPIWIAYPAASFGWDTIIRGISAINGAVYMANFHSANYSGNGFRILNFVSDIFVNDTNTIIYSGQTGGTRFGIASTFDLRYGLNGVRPFSAGLINYECRDVALAVLPNAPIDAATGLPIPTVAIATNYGVSVLKHDGSVQSRVINSNQGGMVHRISFVGGSKIAMSGMAPDSYYGQFIWDFASDALYNLGTGSLPYLGIGSNDPGGPITFLGRDSLVASHYWGNPSSYWGLYAGVGIGEIQYTSTSLASTASMVAGIGKAFNTGWMPASVKGAWLSDATQETVAAPANLISNGTFSSGVSSWSGGGLSWDSANQRAQVTGSTLYGGITHNFSTTPGKFYYFEADVDCSVSGMDVRIQISGIGLRDADIGQNNGSGNKKIYGWFVATTTTHTLQLIPYGGNFASTYYVDNVFACEVQPDRSVNGRGLRVVGALKKEPVATGCDLVAYSGWSGSNYLEQPYNNTMDFGTGDFCFMGWARATAGGNIISRDNSNSVNGVRLTLLNSTTVRVTVTSVIDRDISYSTLNGAWNFFVLQRRNSVISTYVNGVLIDSFANSTNLSGSDKKILIGVGADSSSCYALWRVSSTSQSDAQIKKMYTDEKYLFNENAKATLYGTSDTITALAYDEDTQLLHVGTSSGRSVFDGLRRVDSTTTAVSATISAANGLVVEN